MISVEALNKNYFSVKFKRPVEEHTSRIKKVKGAYFVNKDKGWKVPMSEFDDFEDLFGDEVIYVTPRHVLLGEAPPKSPKFYQKIPMTPVPGIKVPLYPFQTFGAHFLHQIATTDEAGFGFITDKMGLGKTPQGIAGAMLMINEGRVKRVLIVVLASLRKQWVNEGIKFFSDETAIAVIGDKKQRDQAYADSLSQNIRFTVVSYESLLHDMDLLKKGKFDLVIFDEAHKLKNKMGKINRAAERLMKPVKSRKYPGIPYAFFLTGTPLMNNIEELYGLFKLKDRSILGTFDEFQKDFTMYREHKNHSREVIGYKNLSELRRIIRWYMLRRTEHEVKLDLPDVIEKWHYSDMSPLQKKLERMVEGKKASADSLMLSAKTDQMRERAENARKAVHSLRQAIANHPELMLMSKSEAIKKEYGTVVANHKGSKASPKFNDFLDLVEEIVDNGDKVVVFSQFKRMVDIMQKELTKMGIESVTYHGQMDDNQKEDAKDTFKNDPDVKVLIGTESASTGLNLQVARYLINYDLPWNPAIWNQRNGRIRRIGSKHKDITIINMITEDSIDREKMDIIRDKQNLFDATVENDAGQTEALRKLLNEEESAASAT